MYIFTKLSISFSSKLGPREKSISRAFRSLLEDHFYWILVYDRYVENEGKHLKQFCPQIDENYRIAAVQKIKKQCFNQGISRHSKGDIQKMGIEDLQSISNYLGSKVFFMDTENPTEIDFVLFGFLSCILYTLPEDSVFRILVEKRLGNLLQFTNRMKNNFYPDWDEIIGKNSLTEIIPEKPARPPPPVGTKVQNAPAPVANKVQNAPAPVVNKVQNAPAPVGDKVQNSPAKKSAPQAVIKSPATATRKQTAVVQQNVNKNKIDPKIPPKKPPRT